MLKTKKVIALFVSVVLLVTTLLFGCDGKAGVVNSTDQSKEAKTSDNQIQPVETAKKNITFKIFAALHPLEAKYVSNRAENESLKVIMEKTGYKMEFIHPTINQEKESFNLMLASGEYPDIVYGFFDGEYKGGVEAAIKDKILISVNDLIDKNAPNFKRLFLSDSNISKLVKGDSSEIVKFGAPLIPYDPKYGSGKPYVGPMIRKDWLDECGLQIPVTIDDWYNLLKTFKVKKGVIPFAYGMKGYDTLSGSYTFLSAYGVTKDFYKENDTVKYGPIEAGYKEFLTTFNKWYKEGLIDQDFSTHDYYENVWPMLKSGKAASAIVHLWEYTSYDDEVVKANPSAGMVPAPYPVLKQGDEIKMRDHYDGVGSGKYITTSCKNPEEAVKFIDYFYTDESIRLMNWGIEGITYEIVDGKPQMTKIMQEKQEEMLYKYTCDYDRGVVDQQQDEDQYPLKVQHDAWSTWSPAKVTNMLPYAITYTEQESTEQAKIMAEMQPYVDEMFLKFIMGIEPISNYDKYVEKLKSMGIDKVIAIKQASLNRFNKR